MEDLKPITEDHKKLIRSHLDKEANDFIRLNPFGSCQYTPMWNAYVFILELLEDLGPETVASLFLTHDDKIPLHNPSLEDHIKELQGIIESANSDLEPEDLEEYTMDLPNSIEAYYEATSNQGWDLWSSAEGPIDGIWKSNFPEGIFKDDAEKEAFDLEISGGESFENGFRLAYTSYLFHTNPYTFEGFST